MVQATDFRLATVQAVIYTPGLDFRTSRVLARLLPATEDLFSDGEPELLNFPLPIEVPRVVLRSKGDRWRLQAGPQRLDLFRQAEQDEVISLNDILRRAQEIFTEYKSATDARIGRLACVLARIAVVDEAAREVTRHFCRDEWLKGPLNRPCDFELHAAKQFDLLPGLRINSWFRCRAGLLTLNGQPPAPGLTVQQDFNTMEEESRDFTKSERADFFNAVPAEFDNVLNLYFPERST